MRRRRAAVITVSDGVSGGTRVDTSGPAVADLIGADGFEVEAHLVPDEPDLIERLLRELAPRVELILTTGGTGFGPRDTTPEASRAVIEREAPGLAEAMRAAGRASTPMADLSRGIAGIAGGALVLNLPGSPEGATASLRAVQPVLGHALDHLAGDTEHGGSS